MSSSSDNAFDLLSASTLDWKQRVAHVTETMRRVSMHVDPQEMVREYTVRMAEVLHYDRILSLSRRGVAPPKFLLARDTVRGQVAPEPWTHRERLPVLEGGLLGEMMFGNEARIIGDLDISPADPAAHLLRGYRSLAALPVFDGGEALNLVVFIHKQPNAFDPESLPQMVLNTNLFGRATHNLVLAAQLSKANASLDREMKIIADIQRSLLPQELPKIPTLDLAAFYAPATQAGGDYYDFFPLPGGRWGILIADVAGHGSPAAVLMAITHALAHTIGTSRCAQDSDVDPAAMFAYLNHHLAARYTGGTARFVTAFFAVYDPATRRITYSSAGHPPPRVKRCQTGQVFELENVGGIPLGIDPDSPFPAASMQFTPGDQILLYTDGITDTRNRAGDLFGVERLDQSIKKCRKDAAGIIDAVLADLNAFAEGRDPDDDRTLLIAKVT